METDGLIHQRDEVIAEVQEIRKVLTQAQQESE